jgi:hypothetical protein
MNRETDNPTTQDSALINAEAALRRIASLPVPAGLEDRIHATLACGQTRGSGRLLEWPAASGSGNAWLRSAAAAAIAVVVVGGGWGVYSRVQPWQPVRAVPAPVIGAQGSFGGAGAIRTPQTLTGPVLTHSVTAQDKTEKSQAEQSRKGAAKKPAVQKPVVRAATDNR